MEQFPPLNQWFEIITNKPTRHGYTRYDLKFKPNLSQTEIESFIDELCLLIARLRLSKNQYAEWCKFSKNTNQMPDNLKTIFKDRFWKSFISNKTKDKANPIRDPMALQGHIGEIFLYLIQTQLDNTRIQASPSKPKEYSKDSGIDCVEIGGNPADPNSLYYVIWECKAITENTPGSYPSKIYSQHLYDTPKNINESLSFFSTLYNNDPILSNFIDDIYGDFYKENPTKKKRLGGCITFSNCEFASDDIFEDFKKKFSDKLADDDVCRQVRLCAIKNLRENIIDKVWEGIWNKLLP